MEGFNTQDHISICSLIRKTMTTLSSASFRLNSFGHRNNFDRPSPEERERQKEEQKLITRFRTINREIRWTGGVASEIVGNMTLQRAEKKFLHSLFMRGGELERIALNLPNADGMQRNISGSIISMICSLFEQPGTTGSTVISERPSNLKSFLLDTEEEIGIGFINPDLYSISDKLIDMFEAAPFRNNYDHFKFFTTTPPEQTSVKKAWSNWNGSCYIRGFDSGMKIIGLSGSDASTTVHVKYYPQMMYIDFQNPTHATNFELTNSTLLLSFISSEGGREEIRYIPNARFLEFVPTLIRYAHLPGYAQQLFSTLQELREVQRKHPSYSHDEYRSLTQ
ncbi:MAG: hypothetical protein WCP97_03195 [bacterium]